MRKNSLLSRVTNVILYSPFFLLIFLVIPAFTILNLKLHLKVSGDLLLENNLAFCICLLARFVCYLVNSRRAIRYGAQRSVPGSALTVERPAGELETKLSAAGYTFAEGGRYGEKRDAGYFGTIILYAGMFLLLAFGSYDYMREYSIMVRLGAGEPMPLDGKGLVGEYEAGIFARTDSLPKLKVVQQILPNAQWPKGATEIALYSADEDNKVLAKGTISPDKTFSYAGLDFHMTKFLFDAVVTISTGKFLVFDGFIKFLPLAHKKGEYSYVAKFTDPDTHKLKGLALLRPEKKALKLEANLEGKKIMDTELELWGEHKKTYGDYVASMEGLAHWSEIRVARSRHTMMLMIGALCAVIGGLLRLLVRPQRVWIEAAGTGSKVRTRGGATLQLVGKA